MPNGSQLPMDEESLKAIERRRHSTELSQHQKDRIARRESVLYSSGTQRTIEDHTALRLSRRLRPTSR